MEVAKPPFEIFPATALDFNKIREALKQAKLVYQDLDPALRHFFVARANGQFQGCIGLEHYGHSGLLRSMWVDEGYRNQGIAGALVAKLEGYASSLGLHALYLLTETAESYFGKRGFQQMDRDLTPEELKASAEFKSLCPASAKLMVKWLN
ncbi:MAG TPA: arsenic resistance N-acetyltransferase ArsN2 [Saprospiraceae bacterium]|nr:arsenic resistance N-acetyltransferase ArsN2 [Saprospiraceae bacterium]HNT22600.1 arsenic resistance N-acetyltransferase ArsN2 [Saprospiraceae bacterium]